MKKTFLTAVLMLVAVSFSWANELGVGYNNGGPSVRFKWADAVTSEMGVIVNYTNDAASPAASTEITLSLAPVNLALYRGEFGQVSIGFVFKDKIIYRVNKDADKSVLFTANDYSLNILLPELELNFPGVKGLSLIGSLGIGTSWGYSPGGKLDSFNMSLFGISMANVGITYYFDLGVSNPAAPAAEPAKIEPVSAEPAKVEPAK
jgi:hypothetical protein